MKFGKYVKNCYWEKNCRRGRLRPRQDNLMDVKGQGILGTQSARFAYCCTKTRLVCSLC
jgi:hypothetical protein